MTEDKQGDKQGLGRRLLVVDDEENMRHMLSLMLAQEGYQVDTAADGGEAVEMVSEAEETRRYAAILCDIRMPVVNGIEFLEVLTETGIPTPIIMMSAYGTMDVAIEALKKGAYDYINKPFNADEVLLTLAKAEERARLKAENARLKEEVQRDYSIEGFLTENERMRDILATVKKVAGYKSSVLLTGESGTGKEILARAIHLESDRADDAFVAINCGAIPENLLESELFGHVKGAFTDAIRNKKGLFEEASGGTLFLDEVGDLPLSLQVKLLRVLQEEEIRPVGGTKSIPVDVRLVAATAKNLEDEAASGRFRRDLFYRLNVLPIYIPPLRDRTDDIPLLARHFIGRHNKRLGLAVKDISGDALAAMMDYPWAGNVRELENTIERAMVMAEGATIEREHLPPRVRDPEAVAVARIPGDEISIKKVTARVEAALIRRALDKTGGNRTHAAKLLEISHRALLYKLKKYGIA